MHPKQNAQENRAQIMIGPTKTVQLGSECWSFPWSLEPRTHNAHIQEWRKTITEASVWAVIWGSCSAASSTPDLYTSLQSTMSSAKVKLDSYQIIEQQTTSSPYTPWSTNTLTKTKPKYSLAL